MKGREGIRKGFNRLSPFYDGLAFLFFGRSLWRSQAHFIPALPRVNSVLVIGGGTGKILTCLISHGIAHRYYYLDISDEMVRRAGERVKKEFPGKLDTISFQSGTVHDLPANVQFDIIITPYVLDMIPADQLMQDMRKMDILLKPVGKWLFTDFSYAGKGLKRALSKALVSMLYFFFRVICSISNSQLPAMENVFKILGYKIEKEKAFLGGLLVSRLYSKA